MTFGSVEAGYTVPFGGMSFLLFALSDPYGWRR